MNLIPFKTYNTPKTETAIVTDTLGNEIEIPKYGCLSWEETELIKTLNTEVQATPQVPAFYYQKAVALILLRNRFKIPSTAKDEDILRYPDEDRTPWRAETLEAVYAFAYREITREGTRMPDIDVVPWDMEEERKKLALQAVIEDKNTDPLVKKLFTGSLSTTSQPKNGSTKRTSRDAR